MVLKHLELRHSNGKLKLSRLLDYSKQFKGFTSQAVSFCQCQVYPVTGPSLLRGFNQYDDITSLLILRKNGETGREREGKREGGREEESTVGRERMILPNQ